MKRKEIMTIYEVRQGIRQAYELLQLVNCHVHDQQVDPIKDADSLRAAYQSLGEVLSAKWTNQLM